MKTIILLTPIIFISFFSICQEEEILYPFNSPYSGAIGFMNSKDEVIIPAIYHSGGTFQDVNLYIVSKKTDKKAIQHFGLYNNKGELVIGFENKYELISLSNYNNGYILVIKDGKWGYINIKNEVKIPIEYDYLGDVLDGKIIASKNKKFGLIDTLQNVIIDFQFDHLSNFSETQSDNHRYAEVEIKEKHGFINEAGNIIIPCKYDYTYPFYNDFAIVKINEKVGVINLKGETIIPLIYDSIRIDYDSNILKASNEADPTLLYLYDYKGKFIRKKILKKRIKE